MQVIPYASACGSLMFAIFTCQPGQNPWAAVKSICNIPKALRKHAFVGYCDPEWLEMQTQENLLTVTSILLQGKPFRAVSYNILLHYTNPLKVCYRKYSNEVSLWQHTFNNPPRLSIAPQKPTHRLLQAIFKASQRQHMLNNPP